MFDEQGNDKIIIAVEDFKYLKFYKITTKLQTVFFIFKIYLVIKTKIINN